MVSSLLIAYFLNQFTVPLDSRNRPDSSVEYIQRVLPSGHLTVDAVSSRSATIPPGAQRVEMLVLEASADCSGDVSIETITVQRRGLGLNSDIASVYAVQRGKRISSSRTISNKDGTIPLNVQGLRIPACTNERISILADFTTNASAAGEHRLELQNIDAFGSTVRIQKRISTVNSTVRTSGRSVGTISVAYLKLNSRVRFGSRQVISRFTLSADTENNHSITAITFTNLGSASDADLQNIFIDFRNRRVSQEVDQLDRDTVRIVFDPPQILEKNQTLSFSLRADVRASRSRTIQFLIEEESDIESAPDYSR